MKCGLKIAFVLLMLINNINIIAMLSRGQQVYRQGLRTVGAAGSIPLAASPSIQRGSMPEVGQAAQQPLWRRWFSSSPISHFDTWFRWRPNPDPTLAKKSPEEFIKEFERILYSKGISFGAGVDTRFRTLWLDDKDFEYLKQLIDANLSYINIPISNMRVRKLGPITLEYGNQSADTLLMKVLSAIFHEGHEKYSESKVILAKLAHYLLDRGAQVLPEYKTKFESDYQHKYSNNDWNSSSEGMGEYVLIRNLGTRLNFDFNNKYQQNNTRSKTGTSSSDFSVKDQLITKFNLDKSATHSEIQAAYYEYAKANSADQEKMKYINGLWNEYRGKKARVRE